MADEQRIPRDHRNPRNQRGHRWPSAGRAEMRTFLRRQPLRLRQRQPDPLMPEREKVATAAKGPRVAPSSARKLHKLDVRAKRRSNRGVYSGQ